MLFALMTRASFADTTTSFQGDFAVESIGDAPYDANLIYESNHPGGVVLSGEKDVDLVCEVLVSSSAGNDPMVLVHPPEGGWPIEADNTVRVQDVWGKEKGKVEYVAEIVFGVVDETADGPVEPVVVSVNATDWSEPQKYLWGCCTPTRMVTIEVESQSDDPWAFVELVGDFTQEGQLTTSPESIRRLDVGIGTGIHELTYQQWGGPDSMQPESFEVSHVASNGMRTTVIPIEVDGDGSWVEGEAGCGCSATHRAGWAPLWVAMPLIGLVRGRGLRRPANVRGVHCS